MTTKMNEFVEKNLKFGSLKSNYSDGLVKEIDSTTFKLKVWDRLNLGKYKIVPAGNNTDIVLIVDLKNKTVVEHERKYYGLPDSDKDVTRFFVF